MLYLSGTWFITQSTPYTKPVWWLPACSQACSFLVRCSYALGTMHDSKFGVGGVFRTFVCFLILLCMLAKVLMIICMSIFLKQFLKQIFENFVAFKVNGNVVYGCVP